MKFPWITRFCSVFPPWSSNLYLTLLVLFAGITGLVLSVVLLTNPEESRFGGDIILLVLLTASNGIIGPFCVFLTAAWYAKGHSGCILRLLLWASSYPFLFTTVHEIADAAGISPQGILAGLATTCMILSVYIFACIDMPGVHIWPDGTRQKGRPRGRERWLRHFRPVPVRS